MKKRFIALTIAFTMLCSTAAFAAPQKPEEIEGEGYIGFDEETTNPDLIEISMSSKNFQWLVTENSAPSITSPKYYVTNDSKAATLKVDLVKFIEKDKVELPGTLDLRLQGDFGADGIDGSNIVGFEGNHTYSAILGTEKSWMYEFGGTYTGTIPNTPLRPTYTMFLNFTLDSYTPVIDANQGE